MSTKPRSDKWRPWIDVSHEALERGISGNKHWCMFAVGVAYSIPGSNRIEVTAEYTRFNLDGWRYCFKVPAWVGKKIASYDPPQNKKPRPFRVQLGQMWGCVPVMKSLPKAPYRKSGEYKAQAAKRKCSKTRSRRWHGLSAPK